MPRGPATRPRSVGAEEAKTGYCFSLIDAQNREYKPYSGHFPAEPFKPTIGLSGDFAPGCAATWSTCRPASPPPPANRCFTYQPTGPGKPDGKPCGTTSSVPTTRPPNPAPPDTTDQTLSTRHPKPDPRNVIRKSWYRPADHACATAKHPAPIQGNHVDDHTKSPTPD
jgi:hypothetical protein